MKKATEEKAVSVARSSADMPAKRNTSMGSSFNPSATRRPYSSCALKKIAHRLYWIRFWAPPNLMI